MSSKHKSFFHRSSRHNVDQRPHSHTRYPRTIATLRDVDVSVGSREFGKAEVDCCFYGSKAKWGVIERNNVGIMYFGLTLSQNFKYRLDWIDIEMTFKAADTTKDSPPTVLEYIAPQILWGPDREEQINLGWKLNAQADVPAIASINLGEVSRTKDLKRTQRWSFRGDRLAQKTAGLYQIVRWTWDSNPNEPQGEVRRLHVAVTVQHASTPFTVEVWVDGKLRGHTLRSMKRMFRSDRDRRLATIVPERQQRNLLEEAIGLDEEIRRKNIVLLPSEGDGPHTTDKSTKQDDTGKSQDKPVQSNEPAKQDSRKSQGGTAKPDDQPQPDEQANQGKTANSDETVKSNEPSQPPEAAIPDNNVAPTEPAKPAQPNEPPIPDPDPRSPTETTPLLQHHPDSPSASRPDASQPDGQTLFKTLLAALQQLRRQLVRIVTQTLGFLSLLGFRRASQKKPSGQRQEQISSSAAEV